MDFNQNKITLLAGCLTLTMLGHSPSMLADLSTNMVSVTQQVRKVTGRVTDGHEPIIGATVKVKGSKIAVITDIDGKFLLNAPAGATLEVSYVGFAPKEVKVSGQGALNIVLSENDQTIGEVVVVG